MFEIQFSYNDCVGTYSIQLCRKSCIAYEGLLHGIVSLFILPIVKYCKNDSDVSIKIDIFECTEIGEMCCTRGCTSESNPSGQFCLACTR